MGGVWCGLETLEKTDSGAIGHPGMICVLGNLDGDKRIRQSYLHLSLQKMFFRP